jgi:hypothetical protein
MIIIEKMYVDNFFDYMLDLKHKATDGSKTLRVQRLSATTGVNIIFCNIFNYFYYLDISFEIVSECSVTPTGEFFVKKTQGVNLHSLELLK